MRVLEEFCRADSGRCGNVQHSPKGVIALAQVREP
jgi:hypothetical protein